MTTNKNRVEYEQRVNRVLDHIREHLSEELTLERLARVAAFSPFHFHRIFKSLTGENVKELIQRTRLESAASKLASRPHADILEIAMDNGFNSASAFARAFKERFGMTATEWRQRGCTPSKAGQPDSKPRQSESKQSQATAVAGEHDPSERRNEDRALHEEIMNVTVKTLPTYHVAYMRHFGPYGPGSGIPQLWQKMTRWAAARDLWTDDRVCLGIALDDPMITEPAKCRYDAAIVIPEGIKIDTAVNVVDIPGRKHATSPFEGSSLAIGRAWMQLFGEWLPKSGYQPDNRVCFELYTGKAWDGTTDHFRCELCVPVRPL